MFSVDIDQQTVEQVFAEVTSKYTEQQLCNYKISAVYDIFNNGFMPIIKKLGSDLLQADKDEQDKHLARAHDMCNAYIKSADEHVYIIDGANILNTMINNIYIKYAHDTAMTSPNKSNKTKLLTTSYTESLEVIFNEACVRLKKFLLSINSDKIIFYIGFKATDDKRENSSKYQHSGHTISKKINANSNVDKTIQEIGQRLLEELVSKKKQTRPESLYYALMYLKTSNMLTQYNVSRIIPFVLYTIMNDVDIVKKKIEFRTSYDHTDSDLDIIHYSHYILKKYMPKHAVVHIVSNDNDYITLLSKNVVYAEYTTPDIVLNYIHSEHAKKIYSNKLLTYLHAVFSDLRYNRSSVIFGLQHDMYQTFTNTVIPMTQKFSFNQLYDICSYTFFRNNDYTNMRIDKHKCAQLFKEAVGNKFICGIHDAKKAYAIAIANGITKYKDETDEKVDAYLEDKLTTFTQFINLYSELLSVNTTAVDIIHMFINTRNIIRAYIDYQLNNMSNKIHEFIDEDANIVGDMIVELMKKYPKRFLLTTLNIPDYNKRAYLVKLNFKYIKELIFKSRNESNSIVRVIDIDNMREFTRKANRRVVITKSIEDIDVTNDDEEISTIVTQCITNASYIENNPIFIKAVLKKVLIK